MAPAESRSRSKVNRAPRHAGAETRWATTAVHLPKVTLQLLKRVAFHRSEAHGGRMSVSKVITDLVEANREDLEAEAKEY